MINLNITSLLQNGQWILVTVVIIFLLGFLMGFVISRGKSQESTQRSINMQRSVIKGKVSEQFAPLFHNFPSDLKLSEGRFFGSPVDFIFYKGLDDKKISEVVFVEVKSGRSPMNETELSLMDTINNKRVRFVSYRTPSSEEMLDGSLKNS